MSVVTIAEAWPAAGRPFTVAELDRMPDDGRRYELLDGALIVSPRPTTIHQVVAGRLYGVLSGACPADRVRSRSRGGPHGPDRRREVHRAAAACHRDQVAQHRSHRPEQEESRVRKVRRPLVLDREPWPVTAGADRLRTAGRPLRSRGGNVSAFHCRPAFYRDDCPGPPDQWTAPLTGDALRRLTAEDLLDLMIDATGSEYVFAVPPCPRTGRHG